MVVNIAGKFPKHAGNRIYHPVVELDHLYILDASRKGRQDIPATAAAYNSGGFGFPQSIGNTGNVMQQIAEVIGITAIKLGHWRTGIGILLYPVLPDFLGRKILARPPGKSNAWVRHPE